MNTDEDFSYIYDSIKKGPPNTHESKVPPVKIPPELAMPYPDDITKEFGYGIYGPDDHLQPTKCIEAYENLIITYNTSLLKDLPREIVNRCTEFAKKTAKLPFDGKTRTVLAKLIENHQAKPDKRPIASYIGGPMNISCHWSEKYKKLIYIFGEFHGDGNDCDKLTKGRFDNPEIIDIEDYLKQYFSFLTAFTDFYIEMHSFVMPEGYYYQFLSHNRMNRLRRTFHKCVDSKLRRGDKECNLSRMHYFDIRQGDVKDKMNRISIFLLDGESLRGILNSTTIDKYTVFENLKAFYDTYNNLIRLFMFLSDSDPAKNTSQHYYNMWYSQIEKFPLLQKELRRVARYQDEDMKSLIVDFIKEELTVKLGRIIEKEECSQEILKTSSIGFNNLCIQYFQDFKKNELPIETIKQYCTQLNKLLEKITNICLTYNCLVIDGYLLARVFKKFDIYTEDSDKKRLTDEPEEPHNIIIYGGTSHCAIYRKFLKQLEFEDKGSYGEMDYEKINTGDVFSCIDMSKIEQPLFSNWPPNKPKALPVFPPNPSVDKDELFKVPEEVIKLGVIGPRSPRYSYKNSIKRIPRAKF
jgi:hypothetical protein